MAKFTSQLPEIGLFGPQIDFLELLNIFFWCLKCFKSTPGHIFHGMDQKIVHQVSSPASIDLKQLNLAHSSSKLAFLDPNVTCLSLKIYIFCFLKCFKSYSGHISNDIDQKNCPLSEFPSQINLIWPNLAHSSQKLAFLDPKLTFQSPKIYFSGV